MESLSIRSDRRPLYLQVGEQLKAFIRSGDFQPNDKLPSEVELSEALNVSRGTIREALRAIQQEGIIVQRQGLGTFVTSSFQITENGLGTLESLDKMCHRMGWSCEYTDLEITPKKLNEEFALLLNLPPGSNCTQVSLVKIINGLRVSFICDLIPEQVMSINEISKYFKGSVLDMMLKKIPSLFDHAKSFILSINSNDQISEKLNISNGESLLLIKEVLLTYDEVPLVVSNNYFMSDVFQFYVVRYLA